MALRTVHSTRNDFLDHVHAGEAFEVEIGGAKRKTGKFGDYLSVVAKALATQTKVWFSAPLSAGLEYGQRIEIVADSAEPSDDGGIVFLKGARRKDAPTPQRREATEIPNLGRVQELFDTAAEKLKYPKVKFELEDGTRVKLYRAGPKSRYCGDVQVVEDKPYGEGRYFGRIQGDTFHPGRDSSDAVVAVLRALAEDPAAYAAGYGQKTGHCCFCTQLLTDPRSVGVGYGPICAGNYGLPWGAC